MKFRNFAIFGLAVAAFTATSAFADTIANLATGLDGSGNLQTTQDAVDANWTYNDPSVSPSNGSAKVATPSGSDWYGGWLGNGSNSSWIAPNPDLQNNGPAPYTFTRTFDLTGYDLTTVGILGSWAIDDSGTLSLNGNVISTIGSGNWGGLTSFTVPTDSPFLNQGANTLTITLTSSDQFLEAVRLEGSVTGDLSAAPEPSTWTLVGLAGIVLVGFRRFASSR